MRDRVKRWITPVGGVVLMLVLVGLVLWVFWDVTRENAAEPTVPAPNVEAVDLSTPDREYDGRPVYEPDFYFLSNRGHYYPAWVIEVEGETYLVVYDHVRVYPLEGKPWPP